MSVSKTQRRFSDVRKKYVKHGRYRFSGLPRAEFSFSRARKRTLAPVFAFTTRKIFSSRRIKEVKIAGGTEAMVAFASNEAFIEFLTGSESANREDVSRNLRNFEVPTQKKKTRYLIIAMETLGGP